MAPRSSVAAPSRMDSFMDFTSPRLHRPAPGCPGSGPNVPSGWDRVLGEDLAQRRDEPQGLVVLALPDVAAEDQAGGASLHGLPGLVAHGVVAGPCRRRRPARGYGSHR